MSTRPQQRGTTVRATWHGVVLAESPDTIRLEGNDYFPPDAVHWEHLVESPTTTRCFWKGRAHYLSVAVDDDVAVDAAWYYPRPWPLARAITDHVAFRGGVRVERGIDDD